MLSPHDQQVAARDPMLPGLRTLLDPQALLRLLRERLRHVQLKDIRGSYLRYKPQTNCLASYHLHTSLGQIDIYAKAYTANDAQKLGKVLRPSASLLGPGSLQLDEIATGIWIFPNDQVLRYLAILADDSDCRRMLKKIVPHGGDFSDYCIHRLAYKPERRFVGQLRVADRSIAVLRFYTSDDFARANHNAKLLKPGKTLRLPGRLGRSKHRAITALEWLEGSLFGDLLERGDLPSSALQDVGRALAEFHHNDSGKLQTKTRQMEVDALGESLEFAGKVFPELGDTFADLLGQLRHYLLQQPQQNHCVHGDFYAQQILLQQDGVAFLDLDETSSGDGAADIGNFLAHLWRAAPRRVEEVRESLFKGYSSAGGRIDPNHINHCTAASLLRLLGEPFRRRESDWPTRMQAILKKAQSLLASTTASAKLKPFAQDHFGVAHDSLMPFLADATDPKRVSSLFSEHLPWPTQLVALRVIRYKPRRRCLIQYDLETSDSHPRSIKLIGKVRAKGLDEHTFKLQRQLWNSGFGEASEDGICVPEPIALIPTLQMWVQRRVAGASSIDLLTTDSQTALPVRLAEAIYKLHHCPVQPRRPHTILDELRILNEKLPLVAERRPDLAERLQGLLKSCASVAQSINLAPSCPIHRDFYHDQVLVDDNHIYLLDLDLFAQGDPALDVGNFIGHLSEYALRKLGDANALAHHERAMTDRYVELAGEDLRRRIGIYAALTIARHVHISTLFEDRSPFTERILALAEQRLAELL